MKIKIILCLVLMTIWGFCGVYGYYIGNEWYMRSSVILTSIFGVGYAILTEIEDIQRGK